MKEYTVEIWAIMKTYHRVVANTPADALTKAREAQAATTMEDSEYINEDGYRILDNTNKVLVESF